MVGPAVGNVEHPPSKALARQAKVVATFMFAERFLCGYDILSRGVKEQEDVEDEAALDHLRDLRNIPSIL